MVITKRYQILTMKQMVKHAIVGTKANVYETIIVWSVKLSIKLKSKPTMASMSYLLKFILVLARQNLSPGTTTIQLIIQKPDTRNWYRNFEIFFEFKRSNKDFDIKWSIFRKSSGDSIVSKSCNLCVFEKLVICNFKDKHRLLNRRLDLVLKCRDESKYILIDYYGID